MFNILDRIIQLRLARGWSEYQLAKEAQMAQSTISTWYSKKKTPSFASLEKICVGFGITLSQFFAGDEEAVPLTREQRDLLEKWGALTPRQKKTLLDLIENMH